jgi:hypothetical protein
MLLFYIKAGFTLFLFIESTSIYKIQYNIRW